MDEVSLLRRIDRLVDVVNSETTLIRQAAKEALHEALADLRAIREAQLRD